MSGRSERPLAAADAGAICGGAAAVHPGGGHGAVAVRPGIGCPDSGWRVVCPGEGRQEAETGRGCAVHIGAALNTFAYAVHHRRRDRRHYTSPIS